MNNLTIKQIGSILFTIAVYTLVFNWKIALVITAGIVWHEMSHILSAKAIGLKTKGLIMIPFVGGIAFVLDKYRSYAQQSFVVLMGPIGGAVSALLAYGLYHLTGQVVFLQACVLLTWFNGFNLLPIGNFLDGSQILRAITYSINNTLGMVCMTVSFLIGVVVLWFLAPIILGIVLVFGGAAIMQEVRDWNNFRNGETYLCSDAYLNQPAKMTPWQLALTIAAYIGAIVCLALLYRHASHIPMSDYKLLFKK